MSSPIFLELAEIIELHAEGIALFGGTAELRDLGLLQSALGMPRATFAGEFLHPDLPSMAGAYLFHLVTNHAFVDGNKRIGAVAARVFLLMNDTAFDPPEQAYGDLVLALATGAAGKEDAIVFIRKHARAAR